MYANGHGFEFDSVQSDRYDQFMAYRIRSEESLAAAVHRIAHEQTAEALEHLTDLDPDESVVAIHECRKRCKEMRGLVRLIRPSLGEYYRTINRSYRNASRHLSDYRDAQALLGTFDELIARSTERLPKGGLVPVRAELAERARRASQAAADNAWPIEQARLLLVEAQDGIDDWPLDDVGRVAIADGMTITYGRGVDALARAQDKPTTHRFHELRKRVKYTRYHLQLLEITAPSILAPLATTMHSLTDGLGDAHDLAVLRSMLMADPDAFGGQDLVDEAVLLLDDHRHCLERRSIAAAVRLFAEPPENFVGRMAGYWAAWEQHGDELPVGEIADLYPVTDDLDDLTMAELRRLASSVRLPNRSTRRRSELIAGLRAHGAAGAAAQ